MAAFTYTAKRSLLAGHTLGLVYSISLKLRPFPLEKEIIRVDQRSMDGSMERMYFGTKRQWSLQTIAMDPAYELAMKEFLDSTADGHAFTADVHGSLVAPVEVVSVFRLDAAESKQRVLQVGGGGSRDWFSYSFSIRET